MTTTYNSPQRAAKGLPPLPSEHAPGFVDGDFMRDGEIVVAAVHDGYARSHCVVGAKDRTVYVKADTMGGLLPWLTEYAALIDGL